MEAPISLDVPDVVQTTRLELRAPRIGDGAIVFPTVQTSLAELKLWMPWASDAYSLDDAERWCRAGAAQFITRVMFNFLMFERGGEHVGNISLFKVDWSVPRCEIGYWLATTRYGTGLMSEAVRALLSLAFDDLKMERVELRCDERNVKSSRVAARCGFELEGTLRHESRGADGALRNMRVYAKLVSDKR